MAEIRYLDLDQITIDEAIQPREELLQKPLQALTQIPSNLVVLGLQLTPCS
jgi:hypothetical protein